jgi:ribosomal protein S5
LIVLWQSLFEVEVTGPGGGPVESDEATPLEDAVEDGFSEVVIVQDAAPLTQGLIRGEDHRPATEVAGVDDVPVPSTTADTRLYAGSYVKLTFGVGAVPGATV